MRSFVIASALATSLAGSAYIARAFLCPIHAPSRGVWELRRIRLYGEPRILTPLDYKRIFGEDNVMYSVVYPAFERWQRDTHKTCVWSYSSDSNATEHIPDWVLAMSLKIYVGQQPLDWAELRGYIAQDIDAHEAKSMWMSCKKRKALWQAKLLHEHIRVETSDDWSVVFGD